MKRMLLATLFILFIYFAPFSHAQVIEQGWGQYGHDARHTWRTSYPVSYAAPVILEKKNIRADEMVQCGEYVVIYNESHTHSNIIVLYVDSFKEAAKFSINGNIYSLNIYDKTIYVNNGSLLAYSTSGTLQWVLKDIPARMMQFSAMGIFLVNMWDNKVYWVSYSGMIKGMWDFGTVSAPPAIFEERVYVPVWNSKDAEHISACIYVINLANNKTSKISVFQDNGIVVNIAIGDDGMVYALIYFHNYSSSTWGINLYALDMEGKKKWDYFGPRTPQTTPNPATHIGKKYIYLLCNHGVYVAAVQLNKSNGVFVRELNFNVTAYAQAFVGDNDSLYVATGRYVYSYLQNGKLNWKVKLDDWVAMGGYKTAMFPYSKCIYVMDTEGYIYKIGAERPAPPTLAPLYAGVLVAAIAAGVILTAIWRKKKVIL